MEDPQKDKDTPTWSLLPKPRRERHTGESSQAPEPGNRPMGSTRHPQESRYGSVEPRGQGDFTAGSFQSTGTSFHPAGAREEEQYHRAPDGQSRPNQPRGNVCMYMYARAWPGLWPLFHIKAVVLNPLKPAGADGWWYSNSKAEPACEPQPPQSA